MTQEQIRHAAVEYAREYHSSGKCGILNTAETAFLAGAESRQSEIDELKIGIAMAQDMISELQKHSK